MPFDYQALFLLDGCFFCVCFFVNSPLHIAQPIVLNVLFLTAAIHVFFFYQQEIMQSLRSTSLLAKGGGGKCGSPSKGLRSQYYLQQIGASMQSLSYLKNYHGDCRRVTSHISANHLNLLIQGRHPGVWYNT